MLEERERVARELHDAVSQTLFSMVYEARAAASHRAPTQNGPSPPCSTWSCRARMP